MRMGVAQACYTVRHGRATITNIPVESGEGTAYSFWLPLSFSGWWTKPILDKGNRIGELDYSISGLENFIASNIGCNL